MHVIQRLRKMLNIQFTFLVLLPHDSIHNKMVAVAKRFTRVNGNKIFHPNSIS